MTGLPSEFYPVCKTFEEGGDCFWSELQQLHARPSKRIKSARIVDFSLSWLADG
jgi:hypothetical protein